MRTPGTYLVFAGWIFVWMHQSGLYYLFREVAEVQSGVNRKDWYEEICVPNSRQARRFLRFDEFRIKPNIASSNGTANGTYRVLCTQNVY